MRYEKAIGFKLFKFRQCQVELWYIPPGYSVPEHYHSHFDSKFLLIFAHNVIFRRNERTIHVKWWKHIGRLFTIKAGDVHNAGVSKYPLIFINIEKWKHKQPTSACQDFTKV